LLLIFAVYEGGYLVVSSLGRNAEVRHEDQVALVWYGRADGEIFKRDLHLSEAKILFQNSMFDEAQESIDIYMTSNEEDYRVWKRQGDVALMRGEKQRALDAYKTAFERGSYNDLGVLHGLIEVYLALGKEDEIEKQRPMIDGLITSFAYAIAVNTHYIDLSTNVEEFVAICNRMAILFPEDAPRYQVMAAKADHHAQIERERLKSRPPGFLW
jgi:tetratricopeptide (TPR) repeat protein